MNILRLAWSFIFVLHIFVFQTSFAYADTPALAAENKTTVDKLAIMPFLEGRPPKHIGDPFSTALDCSIGTLCILDDRFQGDAEIAVTDQFYSALKPPFGDKLIPKAMAQETYSLSIADQEANTIRDLAVSMGKKLGVDHVLAGSVWRFRDKGIDSYGEFSPASVAFAVYLINVKTGEKVWTGKYDKTQHALTDNILNVKDFFQQGAKWLTAKELTKVGVKDLLETFPMPGK